MSRNGQDPGHPHDTAILVGQFTMPRGTFFTTHQHPVHQLLCSERGLLRIRSEQGTWLLPPALALWIPALVPHATGSEGDAVMRGVYVDPVSCPHIDWRDPTVVAMTRLLRALVEHLDRTDLSPDVRSRAELVLLDELRPVPVTSVAVPEPRDPRARAVAEALRTHPADDRPLAEYGRQVRASARTLARLFVTQTGLGFGQWRERLRMQAALPFLAEGLPVESVARRVGYASASSFTAAFHRVVGVTPRQYFPR
ncbi:helix-turn-helix transcriptional regulator [Streptomyces sp. NPDC005492]|uniref:AraC family transcriptional regulator n=1 Tax=Streptomyces sp. NPDC005492 TaxID=3156883 RepID=UPI0033B795F9